MSGAEGGCGRPDGRAPPPVLAEQTVVAGPGGNVDHVIQVLHQVVVVRVGPREIVLTTDHFRRAAFAELVGIGIAVGALWITTLAAPPTASYSQILLYTLLCAVGLSAPGVVRCWLKGEWALVWISPLFAVPLLLLIWWIF